MSAGGLPERWAAVWAAATREALSKLSGEHGGYLVRHGHRVEDHQGAASGAHLGLG